jgi:hypothetical protein
MTDRIAQITAREMMFIQTVRAHNQRKTLWMVTGARINVAEGKKVAIVCIDKKQRDGYRRRFPDIAQCFIVPKSPKELKGGHRWIFDDPLFTHLRGER